MLQPIGETNTKRCVATPTIGGADRGDAIRGPKSCRKCAAHPEFPLYPLALKTGSCRKGCKTAVYLYDQYPNPQLLTFLGIARNSDKAHQFCNAYALTELVQWLFRSAIRVGGLNMTKHPYRPRRKVTVYIPSRRMRNLLVNWLLSGRVCSGPVKPKGQRQVELLARLEGQQMAIAA